MIISEYKAFLTLAEKKLPFYVASINSVNYQPVVHRPLGIEDELFLYTWGGKGIAFVNGQTHELKTGSLLYLPSNTAHEYHCDSDSWKTLYITFGGSGLNDFWNFEPFIKHNTADFEFQKYFDILYKYKMVPNCHKKLSVTLYSMLLDYKEKLEFTSPVSRRKLHIMTRAMHEMAEKKDINLSDIAQRSGMSESHFCRSFKEYTGFRPFEYMNLLKLQKAKELLKSTQMSVSEISHAVGYESHSYFTMLFKRYMGITPSDYRK